MKNSELVENKRHGTLDFPIEYYFVDSESLRYIMPMHWHREFEIIRVVHGCLKAFLNNVEYALFEGDVVLVECGCLHRAEPTDCVYECLVFDPYMLINQSVNTAGKYISAIVESRVDLTRTVSRDSELFSVINRLFDVSREKREFYELSVYGLLFETFAALYREGTLKPIDKIPYNRQTKALVTLVSWIEKNYSEPITLERLAEVSGFNKKYLCRLFKEYTSKTIVEYINTLRIEKACLELISHSITEAAYNSGFNDLSYFCKVFKTQTGMTPGAYKKSVLEG